MAKRLSVEEATARVIDKIKALKNLDCVDIEKHMNGYAALRELEGLDREDVYYAIVFAIFPNNAKEEAPAEPEVTLETLETLETAEPEEAPQLPATVEAEAETEETIEESTGFVLIDGPAPEITTEAEEAAAEPAQLPMVVRKDSEESGNPEIQDEFAEFAEFAEVTSEELRAQAIKEALDTTAKVGKAIIEVGKAAVKVAKAVTETAPAAASKATAGAAWMWGRLIDLYYILSTYLPIGARWLAVHLIWAIQDTIPVLRAAAQKAMKGAKAAGLGTARAASAVAGWVLVAVLAGISVSIKASHMAADGWKLREEIISEQAA